LGKPVHGASNCCRKVKIARTGKWRIGNRCQHFSPMSEQGADFLKVLIR